MICSLYIKTSQYGFAKVNKGVYSHPKFRRGDMEGLTQLRKRVKASSSPSPSKITPPSSPSRMVSPPMSPTREMMDHQSPIHHDASSSERLSILAQAVRVAMVLEAGSGVCKENTFPTFYCWECTGSNSHLSIRWGKWKLESYDKRIKHKGCKPLG